jgi:hypothetical protein
MSLLRPSGIIAKLGVASTVYFPMVGWKQLTQVVVGLQFE